MEERLAREERWIGNTGPRLPHTPGWLHVSQLFQGMGKRHHAGWCEAFGLRAAPDCAERRRPAHIRATGTVQASSPAAFVAVRRSHLRAVSAEATGWAAADRQSASPRWLPSQPQGL